MNPLAEMSERQLAMNETLQEHLKIVKGMDAKMDRVVAELPFLRWTAYTALVVSLLSVVFSVWSRHNPLEVDQDAVSTSIGR